ncbi:MAG: Permease of the drug/metabolite transporter (DMT) superfamily [uncultured Chthoniobacterales bacterium]|uniref:Permease of the drug/metabolite transporter (DMT) superfamily n=1 Tax=uncultured Chthoniobacterales bacterium TaxID=1836801 RepID=A0A6J4HB14_9BACT|nr:MAG: Permease of the drug/metabolite transporter (DMT) superfamily [uncultured Chthoniobacterales bacterium]
MKPPKKSAIIAAFAAIYLIWGSTYLGILFAIESIPPMLMSGSRYLLAGVIMYGLARMQGAPRSGWGDWRTAAIIGAALLLGGNGGVTIAEQWVPSGLAAVVVATVPIYMVLLGWLMKTAPRPTSAVWLGLAGGFAGVALLLAPNADVTTQQYPQLRLGMLVLLCSAFLWSAGSIYSRRAQNAPSPFLAAGQQMICGGGLMLLAGLLTGELPRFDIHRVTWLSFGAWVYLVLIGAIVGFTAYIWLLRHCDPAKVATYAYVNPIVAVMLGAGFAGETLTLRTVLAATLIIGSVALVITAEQWKRKPAPVAAPAPVAD